MPWGCFLQRSVLVRQLNEPPVHEEGQHRLGVASSLDWPLGCHAMAGCELNLDLGWLTGGSVRTDCHCEHRVCFPARISVW